MAVTSPPPRSRPELPQVDRVVPPPFRLPGSHFAAAVGWLVVVAALLPMVAPRLARGQVLEPLVFTTVHAAVLGVLASAIFGALYQFVPGGLGVPLRSVRVGELGFWLHQLGVAALVIGFAAWNGRLQLAGWILIFAAVGAVSYNVLAARRRSPHGKLVGLYITAAHSALGMAMAIALARIGETLGWWHVDRLGLIAAHVQLGAVGFGTLTALGVGSRMLPTFLVSQDDDDARLRLIVGATSLGLVVHAVGAVLGWSRVTLAGAVTLLGSGVLMMDQLLRWFRRRQRTLDDSLRHVATAVAGLGLALVWAGWLTFGDGYQLRRWGAYVVLVVLGWLLMLVIGVMAKIVSHLSYIHLFAKMPGFARVGNPNLLLRADWMRASWLLLSLGALGLAGAVELAAPGAARMAALAWSLGVAITAANYARMLVIGRNPALARGRAPAAGTSGKSAP